jgi:predicted RNA-binding Zn-ribbon protein involved in translation (DUF1610 family)
LKGLSLTKPGGTMDEIVKVPLNLHEVTMAKPDKCILNYYKGIRSPQDAEPYIRYCEDCVYCHGDQCVYKKYTVEITYGNYEPSDRCDREDHYVQFCCGNCGEIIQLLDSISYIYHNLSQHLLHCKYCNTAHRCLSNEKDVYTFAIPVKDKANESHLKGSDLIDSLSYKKALEQATRFMDAMEKQYQNNHPCPECGSHNVHIDIDCLGGGNVAGAEWCDDCGWKNKTNTFPKGGV